MTNKLNWLEAKKVENAILGYKLTLDSVTADTDASLLQEGLRQTLAPVAPILEQRGITIDQLQLALGDDPRDPLDEAITGTWLSYRKELVDIGLTISDSGVDMPILRDDEQRSDELVKLFHAYRENMALTNTTDTLDLVLKEFAEEIATQRTDLEILLSGTGISPDALGSIETDAYSGHSDLWDAMVGKFEMLEVRKK
jgi:hypothetical protein